MPNKAQSIGWGLVGLGRHAERFVAPAIRHSSSGQLTAVFSRDIDKARRFAKEQGNPRTYSDLDALLADANVQAVFICSPNAVHKEQVLCAAEAGKHILCEKPLANTVGDCLAMIEACRRAGVRLGVGFHLRHNPAHILAKGMVDEGVIGDLLFAEVQYMHVSSGAEAIRQRPAWRQDPQSAGGGSFVGTGVHAVDLLRFILQKDITQIFAFADTGWQGLQRERLAQVSLVMEGGKIGSLSAGNMRYPMNQIVLYGELATLRCTGSVGNYGGGRIELISEVGTSVTEVDPCDVYVREVDSFIECIRTEAEPNASGYDGLKVAQVTSGVYESIRTQQMVAIDDNSTMEK